MKGVRLSRPEDRAALERIWNASFPGDEAFARWFLENAYAPERALVFEEGGAPRAMLHLMPVSLRSNGRDLAAAYVYAVATLPECRGRGIAASLLEDAAALERARGKAMLVLVPQSGALFEYYRRQGFSDALFRARRFIAAEGAGAEGFEEDDAPDIPGMRALYEAALAGRDRVARPEADWARSLTYLRAVGVRRGGALAGYAVFEPGGGVREMVAADGFAFRALKEAALRRLGKTEAVAFGPGEPAEPYGMARALIPGVSLPRAYAGLMLD